MSTIRHCSRCGKELTDAASLECGVGPICRGIDNEVLACVFPVNSDDAQAAARQILVNLGRSAPETQAALTAVATEFFKGAAPNTDHRLAVKRLDWACSFAHPEPAIRPACIALTRALGYWGLATILDGQASTSAAEYHACEGRIVVKAAKKGGGPGAFKKVTGWKFDKKSLTWSFPWTAAAAVEMALKTFYPATKLDGFAAVVAAAKEQTPTVAAAPAPSPTVKTTFLGCEIQVQAAVSVTVDGAVLRVKTPYSAAFVAELKTLPYEDRAWSVPGAPGVWTVSAKRAAFVAQLLTKHFPLALAA